MMEWYGPRASYLCVMSTNWAGASERAVGVALLRVGVGEVLHLVVPGLDVEGWGLIPGETQDQGNEDSEEDTSCWGFIALFKVFLKF